MRWKLEMGCWRAHSKRRSSRCHGAISEEEIQLQEPHGIPNGHGAPAKVQAGLENRHRMRRGHFPFRWGNQLADHHREQLLARDMPSSESGRGPGGAIQTKRTDPLADIDKAMQAWDPGRTGAGLRPGAMRLRFPPESPALHKSSSNRNRSLRHSPSGPPRHVKNPSSLRRRHPPPVPANPDGAN